MKIKKEHLNKLGICSGGVIMDFIDKEVEKQARSYFKADVVTGTAEYYFIKPVKLGSKLITKISILSVGNRSIKFAGYLKVGNAISVKFYLVFIKICQKKNLLA